MFFNIFLKHPTTKNKWKSWQIIHNFKNNNTRQLPKYEYESFMNYVLVKKTNMMNSFIMLLK